MKTKTKWRAARVFVNNAPDQWHVITGEWGAPSAAVCQDEKTARLMAAAPELLAALKALHKETITESFNTRDDNEFLKIERDSMTAIEKAQGEKE